MAVPGVTAGSSKRASEPLGLAAVGTSAPVVARWPAVARPGNQVVSCRRALARVAAGTLVVVHSCHRGAESV